LPWFGELDFSRIATLHAAEKVGSHPIVASDVETSERKRHFSIGEALRSRVEFGRVK
jgi:hypothetical protein